MRVIIGVTHWPILFLHSANKRKRSTHTHCTQIAKLYIQIGLYCVKVSPKNSKRQWHPQSCLKSSVLNDYFFFILLIDKTLIWPLIITAIILLFLLFMCHYFVHSMCTSTSIICLTNDYCKLIYKKYLKNGYKMHRLMKEV